MNRALDNDRDLELPKLKQQELMRIIDAVLEGVTLLDKSQGKKVRKATVLFFQHQR